MIGSCPMARKGHFDSLRQWYLRRAADCVRRAERGDDESEIVDPF